MVVHEPIRTDKLQWLPVPTRSVWTPYTYYTGFAFQLKFLGYYPINTLIYPVSLRVMENIDVEIFIWSNL